MDCPSVTRDLSLSEIGSESAPNPEPGELAEYSSDETHVKAYTTLELLSLLIT
jgi:hypothetical protein